MKNENGKSKAKKFMYPVLSLFLICLFSVLLLAVVNEFTKDKIGNSDRTDEEVQREAMFPEAKSYNERENYAECLDQNGNVIGYAFVTQGAGYGGTITVMTGIKTDGVIVGVTVLSHSETPSFGGKAIDEGLTDEYKGKTAELFVKGQNIDGKTGATRTTDGVIAAVNEAVSRFGSIKEGA